MRVYAVGIEDHDAFVTLPTAIYSTLEAAKAHHARMSGDGLVWSDDGTGELWSAYPGPHAQYECVIGAYDVI